jgi:UDP-2,4-diacetamido-2,4,6-trideoxy-beta-L-altropyranose hydrolase
MSRSEHLLAVIYAAVGIETGWGHFVRCSALADALVEEGWQVDFLHSPDARLTDGVLSSASFNLIPLEYPIDDVRTRTDLSLRYADGCELLILDDYAIDATVEALFGPWARRVLVMEDRLGRAHECDLILDPTPDRVRQDYIAELNASTAVLTGARHALLRDGFHSIQHSPASPPRVLVSLGATDPDNATCGVLDALTGITVDVVLAGTAPFLDEVRRKVEKCGADSVLHVDVTPQQLAQLMARCTLAVGAGGSGAWERCAAGLPSVVIETADNQSDVIGAVLRHGAAVAGGELSVLVGGLLKDATRCSKMSIAGRQLCDGLGASRVARMLTGIPIRDGGKLTLRPAAPGDCARMFDWQRHRATRRFANQSVAPSWTEHQSWFDAKMDDSENLIYMAELDGVPSGVLRLDVDGRETWRVSIYVAPEDHGRGIGRALLELGHSIWPRHTFTAEVLADNEVSHKLFVGSAYQLIDGLYRRQASQFENRQTDPQ